MRSASTPPRMPPTAEADSVTVDSAPVAPVPTEKVAPIARQRQREDDQVERVQHVARERGTEGAAPLDAERGEPALAAHLPSPRRGPARGDGAHVLRRTQASSPARARRFTGRWDSACSRSLLCLRRAVAGCGGDEAASTRRSGPPRSASPTRVAPEDREWILAAVDKVRPEARQLIDDVDGMVTIRTFSEPGGGAVGLMREASPGSYEVSFNLAYLDGERKLDRDSTVVHELGHVIDSALVAARAARPARGRAAAQRRLLHRGHAATAPRPRSASPTRSPSGRCAARSPSAGAGYARRHARVARGLGRAAGDPGDRGRGRLAVDLALVARRRRRAARRA